MEKAEYKEQLGIPTLGLVSADVAQMRRVIQPESKHQALCDHFLCGNFGLVIGGARANSVRDTEGVTARGIRHHTTRVITRLSQTASSVERSGKGSKIAQ